MRADEAGGDERLREVDHVVNLVFECRPDMDDCVTGHDNDTVAEQPVLAILECDDPRCPIGSRHVVAPSVAVSRPALSVLQRSRERKCHVCRRSPARARAGPLADGTLWSPASGGLAVGDESQGFVEVLIRQLPDKVEASLAHRRVDLPHVAVVHLPKLLDVIHLTRLTSGEPLARHDGTAASSVHLRGTGAPEAVRLCQMPGSRDRRSPSFSSVTPGRSLSNSVSPIGALSAGGTAPRE